MLATGDMAPTFCLPDADMSEVNLEQFRGRRVLLIFYPKDSSPACIEEVATFSDYEPEFAEHDCVLIGISSDDCLRHAEFRDHEGIGITLLSDAEGEVSQSYGVWREHEVAGVRRGVVRHATFLINRDGGIISVVYDVHDRNHVHDTLNLVKNVH